MIACPLHVLYKFPIALDGREDSPFTWLYSKSLKICIKMKSTFHLIATAPPWIKLDGIPFTTFYIYFLCNKICINFYATQHHLTLEVCFILLNNICTLLSIEWQNLVECCYIWDVGRYNNLINIHSECHGEFLEWLLFFFSYRKTFFFLRQCYENFCIDSFYSLIFFVWRSKIKEGMSWETYIIIIRL